MKEDINNIGKSQEIDVAWLINPDKNNGKQWLIQGIRDEIFRDIFMDLPVNIERIKKCKYLGFLLTKEMKLENGRILGIGISIIGELRILPSNEMEVKLIKILDNPLSRKYLGISSKGNRSVRYLKC